MKYGVAFRVSRRVPNAVFGCNLKNHRLILVHFQGKSFNITVIQVYISTSDAEEGKPSERKRNARGKSGCLRRLYK